jgi:hypothetical protein
LNRGHHQVQKFQHQPAYGHAPPEKPVKDGENRLKKQPVSLDGVGNNPPSSIDRHAVRIPNLQPEASRTAIMPAQVPSSLFNLPEQNGFQPFPIDFIPV